MLEHIGSLVVFGWSLFFAQNSFGKEMKKKEKGEAPWKPAQPGAAQLPQSLTTGPRASAPSFFSPSAFRTGNQLRKESDLGFLGSFPLRLCSHIKAPNLARTPFFPFKPPVRALAAV